METAFRTQATVPRWVDGYAAGLAITIPFMPTLAAIVSVVAYVLLPDGNVPNAARTGAGPTGAAPTDALVAGAAQMSRVTMDAAPGSPGDAVAIGLIVAAMAWLVLGLVARPLTSAESVQPRVFGELRMRLRLLRDRLPAESDLPAGAPPGARQEMVDMLDMAEMEVSGPRSGPAIRWIVGHGYTNVLRDLHRAAEILILLEPEDEVIGDALDDELSLDASSIDGRDRLRAMLRAAVNGLSPSAATTYFPGTAAPQLGSPTPMEARQAIREVHHVVKTFRDDRRDGLVAARYNLIWAMLAVAVPTYLLLALAMLVGVERIVVVTASTFFLVGAIVGLFQRLDRQAKLDEAVEDFGLYQARLISVPLHSGVAAVAGVGLVAILTALAANDAAALPRALVDAFNLTTAPAGLLQAAVFGLTPALLTNGLDKRGDKLLDELTASAPGTSTAS
jgi:hypothetical protein